MFLNKSFPYTLSSRIHIFIGTALGIFVLFILFFLEPFDSGSSRFPFKSVYLSVYGFIAFLMYLMLHLSSTLYYKKTKTWKLFEEIIFCLCFIIISIVLAFFYTELIINKNPKRVNLFHFLGWFQVIFLGFAPLLFTATFLLRKQYAKSVTLPQSEALPEEKTVQKITISSSLKKESLSVYEAAIVYVKSENNYVRFCYFEEEKFQEKLLRSTLANIKKQLPSFIQIHRSYLVSPSYILSLKGNKQKAILHLKETEHTLPVSQSFFNEVERFLNHPK